jgi:hypothetical protein
MAQVRRQAPATGVAAGGKHELASLEPFHRPSRTPKTQAKASRRQRVGSLQGHGRAHVHSGGLGGAAQAGRHRAGPVACGKQAAVILFHKGKTPIGKPGHGVSRGEAAERPEQGLTPRG